MSVAVAPSSAAPLDVRGADAVDDPVELQRCTRWVVDRDGERRAESSLQLSGMYCADCAGTIESALSRVVGVHAASVVAATQRATVRWDPSATRLSSLIEAVRAAGYEAVPDAAASARELRRREHRAALWRLFVASFCAMQVMMLATPGYVSSGDELAADMRRLLNWGGWVLTLPVMWFAAGPFLQGAWRQLRAARIGMDVPVALGILVTFIASMGATFSPGGLFGSEVYFDSLTMFLSFLLAGRYVELRARHRAAESLEAALSRMPETAERRRPDGGWETVSVHRLVVSDVVRVAVGQAFPGDGRIEQGSTEVDESLLTGESTPLSRGEGEAVVGASVNLGAPVLVRLDRLGADTRFEAIVAMMREATGQRPDAARLADRWARPFLWTVLALAAMAAVAWSFIDPSRAWSVAVAVLIVTCPCALSLATPATLVAAAAGMARRGVVFRRLDAIEALANVTTMFLDKTGTLTTDRLTLERVQLGPAAGPMHADEVLERAASLAAWSRHPVSVALRSACTSAATLAWTAIIEMPGQGIEARDPDGEVWRLGSWSFAGGVGPAPDDGQVWLARASGIVASFALGEALRDGAVQAVEGLKAEGLQLILLSGDHRDRAQRLGQQVGIGTVVADARPEDKLACVRQAQATGQRVAMVGDGVNDAPVLALADVALAMGQGALVARAHADAVISSSEPRDLWRARVAARRTMRIVRQNLTWAVVYNLAAIPMALAGWLPPWAAGLGMAASSAGVVLNALRAGR